MTSEFDPSGPRPETSNVRRIAGIDVDESLLSIDDVAVLASGQPPLEHDQETAEAMLKQASIEHRRQRRSRS